MKRMAALLLLLCLCMLAGCSGAPRAAILCVKEAEPAAQAICGQDGRFSYAVASSDTAALQQLESGLCEFALVTAQGWNNYEAQADETARAVSVSPVELSAFYILSRAGGVAQWSRNTRVVIIGEQDGYGDQMAQQVLSCALHGTVRYMSRDEALDALKGRRADVVMGMMAPQDALADDALGRGAELLSMPESLITVRLPDDSMEQKELAAGGQSAQSYALKGELVRGESADEPALEAMRKAMQAAGLAPEEEYAAILE